MKIQKHGGVVLPFWIVLSLLGVLFSPFLALGVSADTFSPTKDTFISQVDSTINFGGSAIIYVDSSLNKNSRGLVAFDLSSIPSNAIISSAQMSLFLFSTTTPESLRTYNLFDLDALWDENSVTWSTQPNTFASPVSSASIVTVGVGKLITWDVTSEISKLILNPATNFGWEIQDSAENSITPESKASYFWSKDNTVESLRQIPQLAVTYTLPPPPPPPPPATTTPDVPTLLLPANGAIVDPASLVLSWSSVGVASTSAPTSYFIQVATSTATTTLNSFATPYATSTALSDAQTTFSGLPDGGYFWQARACDAKSVCSDWSNPFSFSLVTPPPPPPAPPATPSVTSGGGGGNGPIVGTYGLIGSGASAQIASANLGGSSSGNVNSGGVVSTNAGGNGNIVGTALVPPATSGQVSPNVPQNQTSNSATAQKPTNTKSGSGIAQAPTTPGLSQNQEPATTPSNTNQTAQVVNSGGLSGSFWIWTIVIIIVIGIGVFLFTR